MDLLSYFDRTFVLNLPERADRRRQTDKELRRHFSDRMVDERVEYFPAVRPDDAGPFTSRGSHGAFLSTLEMLTIAARTDLGSVLIMQDDVQFRPEYERYSAWLFDQIDGTEWDILQLGYMDPSGATQRHTADAPTLVDFDGEVIGAHCVGFHARIIDPVLDHLTAVRHGVPGDDLMGPMPVDGAFNTFKWCHPNVRRMLPVPSFVDQRSSRSDVSPGRFDRVRVLRPLVGRARTAKAALERQRLRRTLS